VPIITSTRGITQAARCIKHMVMRDDDEHLSSENALATLFYPRAQPRTRLIRLSSLIDSTLFCDEILKNAPAKRAVYQFGCLGHQYVVN
jgi:hypothetical protein